jgi:antitoxin component of MazEF toxin-antitoxin module
MELKIKTKLRQNSGSIITTIPKPIVKLINLNIGDEIEWQFNIEDNRPVVKIIPKNEEDK